ncbi:MAG: N-acetyltransferase family protein [Phycisphaerales bacterium]|nr:N-acetyltransferase family protein [Phycisphaerales bacterium]
MTSFQIRLAADSDLPAINAIYNHYVHTSTATYQDAPSTADERAAWFHAHGPRHPITVATSTTNDILAWASLSPFNPRSAYRFTVENSIYVRHDMLRQGLGRTLLADLLARAQTLGHRQIIALISADQPQSLELHRQAGFTQVGHLKNVGLKFNHWLDLILLQHSLPASPG